MEGVGPEILVAQVNLVGTSGMSYQRSEPVTARARTSRFRISGCAPGSEAHMTGTVPDRIACNAGPAPANGTCVMLMPVMDFSHSPAR